MKIYVLSSL